MSDRDRNGDIPGGVRQERRKKSGKKIENSERTVTMVAYMNTGSMRDIRGIPIKPPESRNKNRSVSASTKRAERIKMKTRMRELEDNENQALAARMGPDRGNSGVLATAFSKLKIAKPVTDDRKYGLIVARYARAYGVPVELAHAVIKIESNYRVNARGRAGEIGLMQIKPSTARLMGYSGSVKDLYSPEINIKYGMMYLGKAHQLGGGSTCGTILKYNAGHGARRMNPISSRYCSKVKRQIAQGI